MFNEKCFRSDIGYADVYAIANLYTFLGCGYNSGIYVSRVFICKKIPINYWNQ